MQNFKTRDFCNLRNQNPNYVTCLGLFFVLFLSFSGVSGKAHAQNIAVVELFTTQGCASCPPADRIFEQLENKNASNIISLSCHVTYFNTENWRDPISNDFCSLRHKAYFRSLDLDMLFTPQMIINGKFDTTGNNADTVSAAVRMGMSLNTIQPVQLYKRAGYLDITLPKMRLARPADVWLLSYKKQTQSIISAGQNKGEVINYLNAVQNMTKLMAWDGSYINMAYPTAHLRGDGYAIVAQYPDHLDVVAAGKTH